MAKYKALEKDLDEGFREQLLRLNSDEFEKYLIRLFKDYYDVLFSFDVDYNRYVENSNKKYEIIRKVKNLLSFKYNNIDNFENLERLKLTEEIAYKQMNKLFFMERAYSDLVYHDRTLELVFINETLANLIKIYKEDSSEKLLPIIEDIFKRTNVLIKEIKKLPVPDEKRPDPKILEEYFNNHDPSKIDELNLNSYILKGQLEEFDSILKDLEEILPEEVIDEYETKLNLSRVEEWNQIFKEDKGLISEEEKEAIIKGMIYKEYQAKKKENKYLYEIL